jgi:hypothetical protein
MQIPSGATWREGRNTVARSPRFPFLLAVLLLALPSNAAWPDGAPGRGGPLAYDVTFAPDAAWIGASGSLRAQVALPGERVGLPLDWGVVPPPNAWYRWLPMGGSEARPKEAQAITFGQPAFAPNRPGTYTLEVGWDGDARRIDAALLLVMRPAREQQGARLRGYRIGSYPSRSGRYAPPAGFIEVTPENRDVHVSRNFRIAQFLTKDQHDVWPKYVLVDPLLLDKLELVLLELRAMGVPADRMHVMSGFRTPQYNVRGVGSGGRAALSRHQYGDAADVWIETHERPGHMADLNGDGRIDAKDARVILEAVECVEAKHPALVGGAGVYGATAAHPPFLHIDVRGQRSRW